MSLIEIQRQDEVSISLLQNNNFIIVQLDGKFFVDLKLLDLDNDNIPETVQDENIEIRNSMFSNKCFGVNMLGAEVPIKNNLWKPPFGFIVSVHCINDVKFFICYDENNLPILMGAGDDNFPPIIDQSEFENLIQYDANSNNNQKLQNLVINGTTDGFSLREEYVRLNNENGLLVDDSLTLFISFRYHLNKTNEVYYNDLMNELSINNFRPNFNTLRVTDKFFIDEEIIGFVDLQNRDNKNYLISKIFDFYSSRDLVLNYLNATYNIDYSVPEQPTVITFNGIEINTTFQVESYNETFSAKYVLVDDVLAQNFISSNNNVMPSFLRYDGVKYVILFQSLQTGWFTHVRLQNDELETIHDLSTFNYMGLSIEMSNYGVVNNINMNVPTVVLTNGGQNNDKVIIHKENNFYWAHTLNATNNIVNIEIVSLTEVPVAGPSNGSSSVPDPILSQTDPIPTSATDQQQQTSVTNRKIFNIYTIRSYYSNDLPCMSFPGNLKEGNQQFVFEDTNNDGVYETLILNADLNDLSGGVAASVVDYTNSTWKNNNVFTIEYPNKFTIDRGNGNVYFNRQYFIDDLIVEFNLDTDGNPKAYYAQVYSPQSGYSQLKLYNVSLPNGNKITDDFIYDKIIQCHLNLNIEYTNVYKSAYLKQDNTGYIEVDDLNKKRISKLLCTNSTQAYNLLKTTHGNYLPITLEDVDGDGIYETHVDGHQQNNGMGGYLNPFPYECGLVGKYDNLSGVQVTSPNILNLPNLKMFLLTNERQLSYYNDVPVLMYNITSGEYTYSDIPKSRFIDITSSTVPTSTQVDVGNGVTNWDGVIPPPTPTPTPTPTQIGDWSGNNVSGPTGPISNQNNETSQTETILPGSIFRMYSGYKNKFFPYSVTNVEQPWQNSGEKVVVTATAQNLTWNMCWNIGIRSSTDTGTQFKLENYRNPKDSEQVILNFPKLKSNALETDDVKFYVEKIEGVEKWNVYVPVVTELPLFTLEPRLGCTFTHNQRDGWIHNESHHTGPGVLESGIILTRNSTSIINSDLELYVACTGANINKTSFEVVFSKTIVKANGQGTGIQLVWQPA